MKNKLITILAVLLVLGAIGGGIGYYMYQKPVKNFSDSKAEITLQAGDIFKEFAANETSANAKYVAGDKTIEISGVIRELKNNEDATVTITLDTGNPDASVSCTMTKEASAEAAKLSVGAKVVLKGQCTGFQELISKEVIMIRCGLVK